MYYLLTQSQSAKNTLDLLGTYLISANSMEDIKKKIAELTQKFKHNIANTQLWRKINEKLLGYSFENAKIKENIIAFYTGFYAENIFYTKKEKQGGNQDE